MKNSLLDCVISAEEARKIIGAKKNSLAKEDFEWFDTETNTMRPIEGDYEILYGGTSELKQLKAIPVIVK